MSKLRNLARGQECMLRIPGVCNFNTETTVLAHIRLGTGLSQKPPDTCGVWACSSCHDVIDGRTKTRFSGEEIDSLVLGGLLRQLQWYDKHEVLTVCL